MFSQPGSLNNFHPQVPPPPIGQHDWQWIQHLQEKDRKITELKNKVEELYSSIEQQDKYLDEFEVKIENLEKDVKIKEDLIKDKDVEIKTMKTKQHKLEDDYSKIVKSEEKIRNDNRKFKDDMNSMRKEILKKDQNIANDKKRVIDLQKEIEDLKQENNHKLMKLRNLDEEIKKLKTESEQAKEEKKQVFSCLNIVDLKYKCTLCGERFSTSEDLKLHTIKIHEEPLRENLYGQRINLFMNIQELQRKENNEIHQCNSRCFINHRRFNFIRKKSNIFIDKFNKYHADVNTNIPLANNANNNTFLNEYVNS